MPAGLFFSIYLIVFSAYFAVATDPNEVFFLPGLYSGLTNQRFSFYHSVMVSAAQNWTLVLPSWKMGYNDYIDGFTVPFSYFYEFNDEVLKKSKALQSWRYVTEMPRERLGACFTQLQCSSFNDCKYPTLPVMEGRAKASKTVCLDSDSTYYTLKGIAHKQYNTASLYEAPLLADLRNAMVIRPVFAEVAQLIQRRLVKTFASKSFVSVHYRMEADFLELCSKAAREGWQGSEKRACSDGEAAIHAKLQALQIPHGTVLMFMNGEKADYFKSLPILCGTEDCHASHQHQPDGAPFTLPAHCRSYICVRKEQFWSSEKEAPAGFVSHDMSLSMVDFALATRATLFLGNLYSTMSQELFHVFRAAGKQAEMFNRLCSEIPGNCP